jgi:hypothetical protein
MAFENRGRLVPAILSWMEGENCHLTGDIGSTDIQDIRKQRPCLVYGREGAANSIAGPVVPHFVECRCHGVHLLMQSTMLTGLTRMLYSQFVIPCTTRTTYHSRTPAVDSLSMRPLLP